MQTPKVMRRLRTLSQFLHSAREIAIGRGWSEVKVRLNNDKEVALLTVPACFCDFWAAAIRLRSTTFVVHRVFQRKLPSHGSFTRALIRETEYLEPSI